MVERPRERILTRPVRIGKSPPKDRVLWRDGASAWVSHVVLVETLWVLESVYDVDAGARAKAVEMLLDHRELSLQDPEVVERALGHFRKRPALGFSDCLVLEAARKAGHGPLGTFDRELAKVDGVESLREPAHQLTTFAESASSSITARVATRR